MTGNFARYLILALMFWGIGVPASAGSGVPVFIPFQGRATLPDGTPVNWPATFKFRIYPPGGTCYIYEDTQAVTPNTYGFFSVVLGTLGNRTGPANSFLSIYSNDVAVTDSCGGAYTPNPNEWRRLEVVVDGVAMPQMQTIAASGFAINSQLFDGKASTNYIQVNGAANQTNFQNLTGGGDISALGLHTHDATYAKLSGSNTFAGNVSTSGSFFATNPASTIGIGTNAPNADFEIRKSSPSMMLSATASGGGNMSMNFNSGVTQRARIQASESTNELRIFTGSTEAMRIDGTQNVFFSGSMDINGTITPGQYNNAQEATLVTALSGLGASVVGSIWYNTQTNRLKFWDGTSAVGIGATSYVTSVGAGTGLTNSGSGVAPVLNVTYGNTAGTAIQGNAAFAGDVSGNYSANTVARLQGRAVANTAPNAGEILTWNNTLSTWEPSAPPPSSVTSVFGRAGAVVAAANDYTWAQINKTTSSLADLTTRSASDLSSGTLNDARLSANVPLKNGVNAFTNENSITVATTTNNALVLRTTDNNTSNAIFEAQNSSATPVVTIRADGAAVSATDLTTKAYVDGGLSAKLNLSGGTMTGSIAMGSSKITNLGDPTAAQDAATKVYADTHLATRTLASTAPNPNEVLSWNGSMWLPSALPADAGMTALTGDISASGSGSQAAVIALNAVTTTKIADDAVTSAKLRSTGIAVNRLLITDPTTGGTVVYKTCALGEILKWTGTGWACAADDNVAGAVTSITGDVSGTGPGAAAVTLTNGVVTSAKIADLAVGSSKLADLAVGNSKITNDAITSAKINSTGIAANRLLITDASTGATVTYKTCSNGEVLKWTGAGWACSADTDTGMIALTGDVSASGSGSQAATIAPGAITNAKIADLAVGTSKIADGAVTDVKISAVAVDKITSGLGKYFTYKPNNGACADGGVLKWVDASQRWECGLDDTGSTSITALVGDVSATGPGIASVTIAPNAVTAAKIATDAVTTIKILNGNVTTTKIADLAVGTSKLANLAVDSTKLADLAVGTSKVADDAITSAKINSTGIAVNRLLITDSSTGATVTYKTCSNGEVLKWSGTGWGCAADTDTDTGLTALTGDVSAAGNGSQAATIALGSVTGAKIADLAVGTSKLANLAVTDAKIADVAVDKITSATGKYFSYLPNGVQCADNGVLKWVAASQRWICATDNDGTTAVTSLTGDVSGTGPGATAITLTNGVVSTAKLADGAVTTLKIADLAVATSKLADGSVTSVKIADLAVGTSKLANDAVISAKVNSTGIAVNRLVTTDASSGTTLTYKTCALGEILKWTASGWGCTTETDTGITALTGDVSASGNGTQAATLALNAVTTPKINDGAVTTSKIADLSVGSSKIADLAVGTSKLSNDAVTSAKINSTGIAVNRLLITDSSTGATVTYKTCSNGEVLKWSGTGWGCAADTDTDTGLTALTGDVSAAGNGSQAATLALNAVTTLKINDGAVTTSKIADLAVGTSKIADLAVGTSKIANDAIVSAKINSTGVAVNRILITDAVTGSTVTYKTCANGEILKWSGTGWGCAADDSAANAMSSVVGDMSGSGPGATTVTLTNSAVTTAKINDGAVTTVKIADLAVGTSKLADNSVTTLKIADLAVGTSKVANDAITSAKINSTGIAVNRLLITDSSTGATVTYKTCSNGEVLKWSGTGWGCAADTDTGLTALTGDVSASGNGSQAATIALGSVSTAKIADLAVGTSKIADGAVTDVKIASVAVDKIASASGKYFSYLPNGTQCADGGVLKWVVASQRWVCGADNDGTVAVTSLTGDVSGTGPGATAVTLTNGAVTTAKIADLAVGSSKLADLAVGTSKITNLAVTSAKIADLAIGTSKIADDAVLSAKINSTGIAVNRLLITDASTGTSVTYKTCSNGEVLKYNTGTGWACAADTDTGLTALTGDVTASGNGSQPATIALGAVSTAKIADLAVGTSKIADGAVTDVKIAAVAVDKITSGSGKYFSYLPNGAQCADGGVLKWVVASQRWACGLDTDTDTGLTALTGDVSAAGNGSQAAVLALNAVTTAKINDGAVTTSKIADLAVGTSKIADLAVGTSKIANDAVLSAKINSTGIAVNRILITDATTGNTVTYKTCSIGEILKWSGTGWGCAADDSAANAMTSVTGDMSGAGPGATAVTLTNGAVTSAKIADLAVGSSKLADLAVGTSKLANLAVTDAKIADVGVDKITSGAAKYFGYKPNNAQCADGGVLKWVVASQRWDCGTDTDTGLTALTGDVTASGSGSQAATIALGSVTTAKIADLAVATSKIADGAVTDVKIAAVAVDKITSATGKYLSYLPNGVQCADNGVLKWVSASQRWVCGSDNDGTTAVTSLTGDVSGTGPGATAITLTNGAVTTAKIADLAVGTSKLAALAVTDAKIADVGVDKITSGAAKYFGYKPNNAQCADGGVLKWVVASQRWDCGTDTDTDTGITALTGDVSASGNGTQAATIGLNAITTAKIADLAIATSKIADNAITAAKLNTTGVAINRIVMTDSVAPNTLVFKSCANGEVLTWGGSGFACATPTNGDITAVIAGTGLANGGTSGDVTLDIASIANQRIFANISGGSAAPSANTLTAILDSVLGTTRGSVIYRNATVWTTLAPGTAGKALVTGGAGADPSWTDVSIGSSSGVTGTLGVANGGTGVASVTANRFLLGNGTSPLQEMAAGSANQIMMSQGASTPIWSTATYPATASGTGTVLRANGTNFVASTSTFADTYAANTLLFASSANAVIGLGTSASSVLTSSAGSVPTWVTSLGVANGGTGRATLAANGLLVGAATGAINSVGVGTTGQMLRSSGTGADPVWSTPTYANAYAINTILYNGAANTVTGLTPANDSVLTSNGTGVPAWTTSNSTFVMVGGQTSGALSFGTNTANAVTVKTNNATAVTIASGGAVTVVGNVTAPAFFYTSDRRLKKNFAPAPGLEAILKMNPVRFDWKKNGEHDIGFIAQEVERVLPEFVSTDESTGLKAVKYGNIVAPLVASTQELYGMSLESTARLQKMQATLDRVTAENLELRKQMQEIREILLTK